jgi:GST-like protein
VIDLYTWTTPNGRKVSIMLEEVGLPYKAIPINISKDEQFAPDFLKISPNNKIPAIVDHDTGVAMMESGAILIYLAEKSKKLMPKDDKGRWRVLEWLMFQMASVGPNFGQVHHFVKFNPGKAPSAEQRFLAEAKRLYGVMNKRLGEADYLAGEYSIADIATWPWVSRYDFQTIDLNEYPNVKRWYLALAKRPGFQRGYDVPSKVGELPIPA